jgi:geranylgeranyl pyrophosphate synthase
MPLVDPARIPHSLAGFFEEVRAEVERDLERRLAPPTSLRAGDPALRLGEAMRYATLGAGKRLRPVLVVAACEAVGGGRAAALPAASAVELLHAYTLVHDDLPAMDDDDERRGRPTVHVAYDEATAILAGDGLCTLAFGALADLGPRAGEALEVMARRTGAAELLAGQARDLATKDHAPLDFDDLEVIHRGKTGALFAAACELGAIAGDASSAVRAALAEYGMTLGLAFQHADDLDDDEHGAHAERSRQRWSELVDHAIGIATALGPDGERLAVLASWVGARG